MADQNHGTPQPSRFLPDSFTRAGGDRPPPSSLSRRRKSWKSLGVVYEKKFHGLLLREDGPIAPAWPNRSFSALIDCRASWSAARLRRLARTLLERGCVMMHAVGEPVEAARLVAAFDALLDDPRRAPSPGRSPYSSITCTDGAGWSETFAEALEWFVLPSGEAEAGLLAVLGDERDFARLVKRFADEVGDLRERIIPCQLADFVPGMAGGWLRRHGGDD